MKRQRGRNRNNNKNNSGNRQLDSNGPDVKVRGSATQIHDKYTALARDAAVSGSRVKAENYRQHAEHYLRLMNIQEAARQAAREEAEAARQARNEDNSGEDTQPNERKGRRYPPRVRKPQHESAEASEIESGADVKSAKDEPTPTDAIAENVDSEPVSAKKKPKAPKSSDDAEGDTEAVSEKKPVRRRRAPSRKSEDVPVEAAE